MTNKAAITPTAYCTEGIPWVHHVTTPECAEVDAETSSRRLLRIARYGNENASFHASKNPNLTTKHRRKLTIVALNDYRDDYRGALGVILNPGLTSSEVAMMSFMVSDRANHVFAATSLHRLPGDSLLLFASSSDKKVQACMVAHEGATDSVYLATYYTVKRDRVLLRRLAENPSLPWIVLERLIEENWDADSVYASLLHENTPIETLFDLNRASLCPELYEKAVAQRHTEAQAWMQEKGFDPDLNIPFDWVREILA